MLRLPVGCIKQILTIIYEINTAINWFQYKIIASLKV